LQKTENNQTVTATESSTPPVGSLLAAVNVAKQITTADTKLVILKAISFELSKGESLAIMGRSGSGKTTLLGILAGLDLASSGEVWLHGSNLSQMDEDQRATVRARNVGFVFQSFQLLPALTALENVMMPLELKSAPEPQAQARVYLEEVDLGNRLHHYPRQLSGGEQQRVAIARAFACRPAILFADEPTGNLDKKTGQQIIDLLFRLNSHSATTLVLVTHDMELARRCQFLRHLENGVLLPADSPS